MFSRRPFRTMPVARMISGIVLLGAACAASTDDWYPRYVAPTPRYVVGPSYDAGAGVAITPAAPIETQTCRTIIKRRVNDFGDVVVIRNQVCAEGAGYGREPWIEPYRGGVYPSDPNVPLAQPDDIGEPG
jgi:hypothetical protein